MTEGGKTPLYTAAEFEEFGYDVVLYPATGFKAAAKALQEVYQEIIKTGTQRGVMNDLLTWEERNEITGLNHFLDLERRYATDAEPTDADETEYERNEKRYRAIKWAEQAFENFNVVPPGTGIVHQVNLEHLGRIVHDRELDGERWLLSDTLVGTDSHTPMIGGIGVVGGIEAEETPALDEKVLVTLENGTEVEIGHGDVVMSS